MVNMVRSQLPRGIRDKFSVGIQFGLEMDEAIAIFRIEDGRYWACNLLPCPEAGPVPMVVPEEFIANLCMEV
jgi:hypothetical protein